MLSYADLPPLPAELLASAPPEMVALLRLLACWLDPKPVKILDWQREINQLYATKHINTRIKMRQALRELIALCPSGATTADVTPALIDQFAARGGRCSTVNGLLASIRAAMKVGAKRRYFRHSLLQECEFRRINRDVPRSKHHGREEIARVLAHLQARADDWQDRRLHVLANIYAYCGLRASEALRLRVVDIDLGRRFLFVRPNGMRLKTLSSEAPVPLAEPLIEPLREWLKEVGSEWVVPRCDRGGPWIHGATGYRPCDRLKRAGEDVGVQGFTPRSLRHSLASHLAGWWGLSPKQIQIMLRHSSELTQKVYIHADLVNLREALTGFRYDALKPAS